jgi:cbb3-type cytochrome oxidase subunit 3
MYKQILEKIEGIGIYPMFSFIVFFLFFLAVTLYVWKADKEKLDHISRLPLQNNDSETTKSDAS